MQKREKIRRRKCFVDRDLRRLLCLMAAFLILTILLAGVTCVLEKSTSQAARTDRVLSTQSEKNITKVGADTEEIYADSLELMAVCVEAEAGNQPLDGRRMVVDVILNRMDSAEFPNTIHGVITQPYHFTSYWDGGMSRVTEPSEETLRAVQMELKERGWPGLLYYDVGGWPAYGTPWKQVGDHYFCTQ